MKYLSFFTLFFVVSLSAFQAKAESDDVFSQVKTLPKEGGFKQQRQLKIIKKPFVSSGHFKINDEHFVWHTTKPFDVSYRISSDAIEETVAGNTKVQKLDANPQMVAFAQIFSSLVQLNKTVLKENFLLQSQTDGGNWSLLLTPKKDPIDKVFETIVIKGDKKIRSILTQTLSGDSNLILLTYDN